LIEKDARMIVLPFFYKVNVGDVVSYKKDDDSKSFMGKVESVEDDNILLSCMNGEKTIEISRDRINSKIVYVFKDPK
ncbi:MAG: hypothetical protein PHZ27_00485, partial [Candidatus Omnitrophica bacterium]|nr:hypothetical protein [Candidatus Omnitrophota bacterium]